MSAEILYQQCTIQKRNKFSTVWIPKTYAIKNKQLKLRDVDGWKVVSVFDKVISESKLRSFERDYLYQRSVSDI